MPKGRLRVIAGPMFSGKSSELLISIKRSRIAGQKAVLFNPIVNDRNSVYKINSRIGIEEEAICVNETDPQEIVGYIHDDVDVVAIDEVQFFHPSIESIIDQLISRGIRVVVSGLDTDFRGEPFGSIPRLLAKADTVIKLSAVCVSCAARGEEVDATRTQLLAEHPVPSKEEKIIVGDKELYEARCRDCHTAPK